MNDNLYRISFPSHQSLKDLNIEQALRDPEIISALAKADNAYLHWEELQHKSWIPANFQTNKEIFWHLLRFKRYSESITTPIKDQHGKFFTINTKNYAEFLHIIDKEMAGNFMGIPPLSSVNKELFITRNLIEESIASSQLEGANTSRAAAKRILLEGRKATNFSEQMIINNHQAMLKIEQEFYKQDLSLELLYELHSIITYKTLDQNKQAKLRETFNEKGERLKVIPWQDDRVAYVTPDKAFVENELPKLINFGNNQEQEKIYFIHPLIKGIMLHFWVGLLHPFEDGNGRLARILFYWYMLKHEYWAFKYFSLSEKIKKSPKQYAMAYIYSEQDMNDLTYFIHYNIEKLKFARNDFQDFIKRKLNENKVNTFKKQEEYQLNERQTKLLRYFNQAMQERTNLSAYQKLYLVKKPTAILDLKSLIEKGFLIKKRLGRNTYYYPTHKVEQFFTN